MNNLDKISILESIQTPNDATKLIYDVLSVTDLKRKGIEIMSFGKRNITNQVTNFLSQQKQDIIFNTQAYQLKKFLGNFKAVEVFVKDSVIRCNGKKVTSQVLQALLSRLVLETENINITNTKFSPSKNIPFSEIPKAA